MLVAADDVTCQQWNENHQISDLLLYNLIVKWELTNQQRPFVDGAILVNVRHIEIWNILQETDRSVARMMLAVFMKIQHSRSPLCIWDVDHNWVKNVSSYLVSGYQCRINIFWYHLLSCPVYRYVRLNIICLFMCCVYASHHKYGPIVT